MREPNHTVLELRYGAFARTIAGAVEIPLRAQTIREDLTVCVRCSGPVRVVAYATERFPLVILPK